MLRGSWKWTGNILFALGSYLLPTVGTAAAQSVSSPSPQVVETAPVKGLTIDFDYFPTGPAPDDFLQVLLGLGKPVTWEIRSEPSARSGQKVLAQTSSEEVSFRFPLLVYNKVRPRNVEIEVFFKPVSGKVDQAAGLVARYQDQDHFYIAYANALEEEVQLSKVVEGARESIARADAPVTTGDWHWMKLIISGSHLQVFFNGVLLIEADDETYDQAGLVGLSTKGDGVTVFDDFLITPTDE
jgi:hypothetical protein